MAITGKLFDAVTKVTFPFQLPDITYVKELPLDVNILLTQSEKSYHIYWIQILDTDEYYLTFFLTNTAKLPLYKIFDNLKECES